MIQRCAGAALLALGLTLLAAPAHAERLWLLIGASDASAAAMAKKAKPLAAKAPASLVMQTNDCGESKNVFAWVAELAGSAEAAQAALPRARQLAPDAYIKRCEARAGSLLALRINAIDPSIAEVPANAVNWREQDRVSVVKPLTGDTARAGPPRNLLVTRYFADTPNDPLEGRRERVSLVEPTGQRIVLQEHCLDVARIALQRGAITLQCTREQAADELLHSVLVFDAAGKKVAEVERCRNPQWPTHTQGGPAITCEGESVDATGRLTLARKLVGLSGSTLK